MFAQKYTIQSLDLKWLIIISIIIHSLIILNVKVNKKPIITPMEINIVLEKKIEKKQIKVTPPKPIIKKPVIKPVEKKPVVKPAETLPEILPVEPIKFEPIIEPMVQEIIDDQVDTKNIVPIDIPTIVPNTSISLDAQRKVIESYGALLTQHISNFKKYPRIAQRRVWEGDILLEITLNKDSKVLNIKIISESRYGVLNKEAIAMIKRAQPLPKAKNINSETFKVFVPVAFKLR
jgi:protein TonB